MTKQSAACRAVLYLRLSRDDDNRGESESIQNQRALLREYAARQGFSVIEEYIDDGWSGTSFDRPRFQDMPVSYTHLDVYKRQGIPPALSMASL